MRMELGSILTYCPFFIKKIDIYITVKYFCKYIHMHEISWECLKFYIYIYIYNYICIVTKKYYTSEKLGEDDIHA